MIGRSWFLVACAAYVLVLAIAAAYFPHQVPIHYSPSGAADRVVSGTRATVEFGLLGFVLAGLFGAMAHWSDRLPMRWIKVPAKDYWSRPDKQQRFRAMLREDLYTFGAVVMVLLTAVVGITLGAARAGRLELGARGWVALGLFLVVIAGYSLWMALFRYRPPAAPVAQ